MLSPEELETRRQELEKKRREKRMARRRRRLFFLACVSIGLLLFGLAAYWGYNSRIPGLRSGVVQGENDVVTLLVLGVDAGLEGGARTDTMMLFSLDKRTGAIGALSIPRDTRVQIPGRRGFDRINAAHAIGGPDLAVRTVEQLLGVDVDYFVRLDFDGFEAIVNTLGGVVLEIDRPMHYVDHAQGLYIDLQPGVQRLSGEQALGYVRYRADRLGDVALVAQGEEESYAGRVNRQLKFVQALADEVLNPKTLLVVPQLIGQLRHAVTTNLSAEDALHFVLHLKDLPAHRLETAVLPGVGEMVGGASYWVVDAPKAREIVNRLIVHRQGMVRVEVLNGSGRDGVASRVADMLREKGFEVVSVGNADHFQYAQTAFISRNGGTERVEEVARALGRSSVQGGMRDLPRTELPIVTSDADVTVIIGRDFKI